MNQNTYQLTLTFEQILSLVEQLPDIEKIQLSQELEKYTLSRKLTELLETFKSDELSLETIDEEVEAVRTELYAKQQTD
jgi:hypothetical protein